MNQRIKELEPQCWEHNEFGLNFNYQKFAELIVRECAEIAYNKQYKHSAAHTRGDCAEAIKQHFGVEE